MFVWLRRLAVLACLGCIPYASQARENFLPLELLGRSEEAQHSTQLDSADWDWLRRKETLVLGTFGPDFPPYRLGSANREFAGITADFLGLIARELGVRGEVRLYPDRAAAMRALQSGEVDLLSLLDSSEPLPGTALSEPYVHYTPVLVRRTGEPRGLTALREGMVAFNDSDFSLPRVENMLPDAVRSPYATSLDAFSAVAFGLEDAVLSDSITAYYLVNAYYANELQVTRPLQTEHEGVRFVLRADEQRLRKVIDGVIRTGISREQRRDILQRWSGGGVTRVEVPVLDQAQKRWIASNPIVRVGVVENLPPLSYFGDDDRHYGISADLLSVIQAQTGLDLVIGRYSTIDGLFEALDEGEVDMVADVTPSLSRRERMRFSRPYLRAPFALVVRVHGRAATSLAQLEGGRVALPRQHVLIPYLREFHPEITLVEVRDVPEAYERVLDGRADATLQSLLSARYYIARLYEGRLRVSMTLSEPLSVSSFALRRGDQELQSILDQALLNVAPDQISALTNRWRSRVVLAPPSWRSYGPLIYQAISIAAILLLAFLGWNFYLRQQIRKRQLAERELSEQVQFMEVLVNGTPHPIYVRDIDMRLRLCNDSYLEAVGIQREEAIGQDNVGHGQLLPEDAAAIARDHHRVVNGRERILVDRVISVRGESRAIYHWMLPHEGSQGDVRGVIGGWIDISDRRALVDQLRTAKEQADQANRTKTSFLATMSHEIRTPLNAVIGMLELALKRERDAPPDRASLEVAYSSARGLLELIGDILDVARIESGHLTLSPERADLRQIAEGVVRVFDGLARQKSLTLRLELEGCLERPVLLDPLRFRQVLSNLISNAIKFTAQGGVTLRLCGEPVEGDYLQLSVEVADTGIGIAAQDQQRLFQPFVQARESSGGSGLGLMICRNLVEMMDGTLALESEEGVGTCVRVQLKLLRLEPLSQTDEPPAAARQVALPRFRVLVVDDHPANRLLLCQQLKFLGQEVDCAADGDSALELWQAQPFDLVITDCNMPVMDGYALTAAIRAAGPEGRRCTVLGFTANAQPEQRQRCLDAGMDGCLFKPVELAALSQALSEIESTAPGQEPTRAFDLMALEKMTGGNAEVVTQLLEQMLDSTREDLAMLETLRAGGDLQALDELAHRIKGAARIVRATGLIACCETLEQACRALDATRAEFAGQRLAESMRNLAIAIERALLAR